MKSIRITSLCCRVIAFIGCAIILNACGPRGLQNAEMNSANHSQEDKLLNRLFRESPAGQPPSFEPTPAPTPAPPQPQEQEQPVPEQEEPPVPQQPEPPTVPRQPDVRQPAPHRAQQPPAPVKQGHGSEQDEPAPLPAQVRGYWDDKVADGRKWTAIAVQALNNFGGNLLNEVPEDISNYCPRYSKLGRIERIDFWVKMISAIAAVESGYRPGSSYKEKMNDRNGNRVVSRGLLQISLESSHLYGCATNNDGDLVSPKRNIECGVKILNRLVPDDHVISRQANARWYGAARYWSTLRPVNKSSKTIRDLLKTNPRCR